MAKGLQGTKRSTSWIDDLTGAEIIIYEFTHLYYFGKFYKHTIHFPCGRNFVDWAWSMEGIEDMSKIYTLPYRMSLKFITARLATRGTV